MEKVRTEPLETPRTAPGEFADGDQAGPFGGGRSPAGEPEAAERAVIAGEEPKNEAEPKTEETVADPAVADASQTEETTVRESEAV